MNIPYTPKSDDAIVLSLLCCFFLTAFLLSRSRLFIVQLAKDYLLHRERNSIFDAPSVSDMRFLTLFILQTCVLAGVCTFIGFSKFRPDLTEHLPSVGLLGIYIGVYALFLALKWVVYSFLGWIFFDEEKVSLWFSSYSTLLYYLGFALFPLVLGIVYLDLEWEACVLISSVSVVFTKLLILFKWIKLFCGNSYGCFLLIVYFCALEIMPCFLLFRGMMLLNDCFIIKI